ncbi:MAG: ankyrin repeat domain-containing protein, partial [Myxococcales bacterium]|nr:ankyrin repeat domain-containing protein [Myxococcales bacterium]
MKRGLARGVAIGLAGWLLVAASVARAGAETLLEAARAGDRGVVERLLDEGADPAAGDAAGVTALHAAAAAGRGDVVELLLARGVFVDQAEFDGDTALANA